MKFFTLVCKWQTWPAQFAVCTAGYKLDQSWITPHLPSHNVTWQSSLRTITHRYRKSTCSPTYFFQQQNTLHWNCETPSSVLYTGLVHFPLGAGCTFAATLRSWELSSPESSCTLVFLGHSSSLQLPASQQLQQSKQIFKYFQQTGPARFTYQAGWV